MTLQTTTQTRGSDYGDVVDTWADTAQMWANIEPLVGREFFDGHVTQAVVSHRITIPYRDSVIPKQRISWSGRLFDIETVIRPEERRKEMQLMCRELVNP